MAILAVSPAPLIFGIFPGITGSEGGLYPSAWQSYDPDRTEVALALLAPPHRPFVVRCYTIFAGAGQVEYTTPPDPFRYVHGTRQLDSVLCYRSQDGNVADWLAFIRAMIQEHGTRIAALQVTEEANNPDVRTGGDGGSPNVIDALVSGVIAAKAEARALGLEMAIGFNATPSFNPADPFWPTLAAAITPDFLDALDYVGLDFFPDVFRPVAEGELANAVRAVVSHFRTVNLAAAGIPHRVPIRITEHGWPTTQLRSQERQVHVLETVIRTLHELRGNANISHYELFALRDARDGEVDELCQFGLVRTDYSPKPAFDAYRTLVAELGGTTATS